MNASKRLEALGAALRADLDFHGTSGGYGSHSWHPFPAKFPPQLPEFLINRLSEAGEIVLDPMLGSGTTLVEAVRLGRRAVGCDIDPLARLIAEAKLTPIDPVAALEAGRGVLNAARNDYWDEIDVLERDLEGRFDAKTRDFVDYWFTPKSQLELLALTRRIDALDDQDIRRFLRVAFSSTIIAKSGGVSLARDLAHTRPHRDNAKNPGSAFVEFSKRLERNVETLTKDGSRAPLYGSPSAEQSTLTLFPRYLKESQAPIDETGNASVRAARADNTGLPSDSVDLVVTSPPYANNAIDYMRAHKFSLVWFGWKTKELTQLRSRYLGHESMRGPEYADLPEQCEQTLAKLAEHDSRKAMVLRRYFGEMSAVLEEMRRVLRNGRAAVVVVGTSVLRSVDVETHKGIASIGKSVGFDLVGIGVRRLDRDRRMMPARWGRQNQSQIEKRMHQEYVIGMVKS